jgi:release factor glutamine methyltransferase
MSSETTWTIARLLTWTTDYLRQHGSDSPRLDAELLLAHALDCQRIALYTSYDQIASPETRAEFRQLVRQRAEGTPVAYLVGYREFYSLPFQVTPDVLIPRPETEQLVLEVLERAQDMAQPVTLADVGTGSGILAICCAKYLPDARVWATDCQPRALALAAENAQRHQVQDRITWCEGDLLEPIPADVQLQLVVSNPPYVSQSEYDQLSATVRNYEPREALLAGPTGTEVIERLAPQAAARLISGGWLILEISPMIARRVSEQVAGTGEFEQVETVQDMAGHLRLLRACRK